MRLKIGFAALMAAGLLAAPASAQQKQFISIGTGGVTGVYYPTGGAICRLVNKMRKKTGIRCSAESTGGSIYNINSIRAGDLDMALAQSDWHFHAYNGLSKFSDVGPFKDLRSVFSVHPEPVTMFARKDAGITNVTDLKDKRVNIGNVGSLNRRMWEVMERALGWDRLNLKLATEMKSLEVIAAACDNKIDAYFWSYSNPSALAQEALSACPTRLVNVVDPAIQKLVDERP